MAKMNSKFKYMYDAAPAVSLRAQGEAALTADANSNVIALDQLDGYWNTEGELADQTFAVVANVTGIELGDDETYELALQFGDDAAFTTAVTTHTAAVSGTGQIAFLVDIDTVKAILSDATHMRLALDVEAATGSPSIEFYSWIAGAIIR